MSIMHKVAGCKQETSRERLRKIWQKILKEQF